MKMSTAPGPFSCKECGHEFPPGWDGIGCPRCVLGLAMTFLDDVERRPAHTPAGSMEFGDYELEEEIGRGGMGVVYRARQRSLNRLVAVKMLLAGQLASAEAVRRFRTEAEAAARLEHEAILPVHEIGEHETFHYFTMRLVEPCRTIADLRCSDACTRHEQRHVAALMAQVARAIACAHSHGVLHRDLKPGNILVDEAGRPFVTDFGLAKLVEAPEEELTLTSAVLGSPGWLAPEQAAGNARDVSTLTDVHGLGAVLYHLLTGRPPFQRASTVATLRAVAEASVVPPRAIRPGVDRDLEVICLKCLEKSPAHRYASAAEVAVDLERFVRGEPVQARPVPPAVRLARWMRRRPVAAAWAAFGLLAGLGGLAAVLWQWQEAVHARAVADDRTAALRENLYFAGIDRVVQARQQHDFRTAREWLAALEQDGSRDLFAGPEWGLLWQLCSGDQAEVHELAANAQAQAISWSPDGGQFLIAAGDGTVQTRHADTVEVLSTWGPLAGAPWTSAAHSPSGRHVLLTGQGGVLVLDAATGTVIFRDDGTVTAVWKDATHLLVARPLPASPALEEVELSPAPRRRVLDAGAGAPVALAAEGVTLAATTADGRCRVLDAATGRVRGEFGIEVAGGESGAIAHQHWRLQRVQVSPNGRWVAVAWNHPASGSRVIVVEAEGAVPVSHDAFAGPLAVLDFHPTQDAILVAEEGAADIRRIDFRLARPRELTVVQEPGRPAYPVFDDHCSQPDPAPAGGQLPLALPARWLTRSAHGGRTKFHLGHGGAVRAAAWNPAGDWVASVADDRTLRLWSEPVGHTGRITAAVNMPDGRRPVVSSDGWLVAFLREPLDARARVFDRRAARSTTLDSGYPVGVFADRTVLTLDADGCFILRRLGEDHTLTETWSLDAPALRSAETEDPRACVTSADERLVAGVAAGRVFVIDRAARTVTTSEVFAPDAGAGQIDLTFGGGDAWLALTGHGPVRVLDARTLRVTREFSPAEPVSIPSCVAAMGQRLFVGCGDGRVVEWNAVTGALVRQWSTRQTSVTALAVLPSGRCLCIAGPHELTLWDADGRRIRCTLPMAGALDWLRFTRDGTQLFQSGRTMALEAWRTGE